MTVDAIGFAPASPLSLSSDSGDSIELIIEGDGTLHTELSGRIVQSRFMAHGILNNNARFTVVVDRIG